jgi:tripartite-type tricarboxylate transporter receptor subunit TctC
MPAVLPHVKSGSLKVLAVSSAKRSAIAPDVPTIAETTGMKDFDFTLWAGVFAPRDTPKSIVDKLNTEINKVLNDPETKAKLVDAGAEVEAMSVAQFRAFVDGESSKYLRIIKETGVTAE